MAGADSSEIQDAFIEETTPNTTPATPGFTKSSFDLITMRGDPRISENTPKSTGGQRSGISRNGVSVSGEARGKLVYGEYDSFFESLFQGTWAGDVLVNGTAQQTLTIEQATPQGAGGALAYTRFRGVEVSNGRLEIVAEQDVQVFFDLLGQSREDATATVIPSSTYADPAVTDIIGSGADVGTLTMSGFTLDCMEALRIDFNVGGKNEQPRIASDDPCGISRGVMRPVLTGRFYIETNFIDFFNEATTGTDFALTVGLGNTTTEKYELLFPSCEFVQTPLVPQEDGPSFLEFQILPKYDTGISGTCQLTRAVV